jgi:hypothetical protein
MKRGMCTITHAHARMMLSHQPYSSTLRQRSSAPGRNLAWTCTHPITWFSAGPTSSSSSPPINTTLLPLGRGAWPEEYRAMSVCRAAASPELASKATRKREEVVWCGVVWCGVVWCGVVWCGVVWCGVVWCGVVWCGVVQYGTARCSSVHSVTVLAPSSRPPVPWSANE